MHPSHVYQLDRSTGELLDNYKYLHEILYGKAAPIGPYFLRHIKPLPTPTITEHLPPDYLEQHHRPAPPKS